MKTDLAKIKKDITWLINQVKCFMSVFPAATTWSSNHSATTGNKYLKDTLVWFDGFIYKCLVDNNSNPTSNSFYWEKVTKGWLLQQEQADWNATGGPSFIRNKPTSLGGGEIPTFQEVTTAGAITNKDVRFFNSFNSLPGVEILQNLDDFAAIRVWATDGGPGTNNYLQLRGDGTISGSYGSNLRTTLAFPSGVTENYGLILPLGNGYIAKSVNGQAADINGDVTISVVGDYLPLAGGTMDADADILFANGSKISEGVVDALTGGAKGIALTCSVGYEFKWEAGEGYITDLTFNVISSKIYARFTPTPNDDSTKGYGYYSHWNTAIGGTYRCIDATPGAAVWEEIHIFSNFVPYTGAAAEVDLGYNILRAGSLVTQTNGPTKRMILSSTNVLLDHTAEWQDKDYIGIADITDIPTSTSQLTNDGADGVNPFITALDIPPSTNGLPTGGTAGQILTKVDATDYNATWVDEAPAASFTSTIKHKVKLGLAIAKGQAVYVSSASGTNMIVSKASNVSESTSSKTMGLLETGGSTNAQVNVVTEGLLAGLDTSTATIGDPVWLGVNGDLIYGLINKPYAPAHLVFIGVVTRVNASTGEIFVKVQNGFELKEIHDVDLKTNLPTNNQVLAYESATDLWKNKTIVEDAIVNGVTDKAPSQNAVFDALDSLFEFNILRQNTAYIVPLGLVNIQSGFSLSPNISSWSLVLQGNTITGGIGGFVKFDTSATAGTLAFRRGSFGIILANYQFEYTQKVRFQTNLTGQRGLWGLSAGYTFASPTNVEPNTNTSVVGVCQLSTSTNLHIIHNDASGIATTFDLGVNYPCNTNIYTYYIKIKRTLVDYTITVERLTNTDNSIISTTYTTSTNIPAFSLANFSPINYITNNAQAVIASYFDGGCMAKITHQ